MRDPKNIAELLKLGPDYMGMIFYHKSPRYVPMDSDSAIKQKFSRTRKVGVFVNEDYDKIVEIANEFQLDAIQLHGNESPELCKRLRGKYEVFKAFGIASADDLAKTSDYVGAVDMLVLDTKTSGFGGSGQKFDWSILDGNVSIPFLLSGGIGPGDIATVKTLQIRNMVGIDLNSKFETAPALKNVELLAEFLGKIERRRRGFFLNTENTECTEVHSFFLYK